MDLSQESLYEQNNLYNYPHNNIRARKSRKSSPYKKKSILNNNNILQFSLSAINNILINNLNSSVSLGFLNLTNSDFFPKKLNNNLYINSLYDSIDYKIKGNIYKQDKYTLLNKFPNLSMILRNNSYKNKNKHDIKIMKFDKEIINIKNKTPIKKLNKNYYLNLMKSNNDNSYKNKHHKINSENIDINMDFEENEHLEIKSPKINNNYNNYAIYRTCETINNSNDKLRQIYQNNNINKNAYIKKISPNKKYIINKTTMNSKEKNIKENQTKNIEPNNQVLFKNKYIYKTIKTSTNSPKKLIIINNKTKENILKNKNKEILNKKPNLILQNKLPKQIKHEHCQSYNINSYKPNINTERNTHNINITNNKNIITKRNTNTNMNKLNKIKYLTLTNVNNPKTDRNKNYNYNYNIPFSPQNVKSNNNNNNKIEIISRPKNKNKYVLYNNKTMITNKPILKNINKEKKNNVFNDDENSIFKVIDNTQIMTPDEFSNSKNSNSLMNSNKLYQLNGSNGTNTNQDTDYNSIKKFNTNKFLTNEDLMKDNYYNNSGNEINFSFNNL